MRGQMDANWSAASTDSEGRFSIDVKGAPQFLRLVSAAGDTLDMAIEAISCNSSRDIALPAAVEKTDYSYRSLIGGVQLPEVILQAFGIQRPLLRTPAAVGVIDQQLLNSTDQSSLQNAMNTLPGVMMETRGYGGSQRFSIRGSSLRSPFAVRNIKMYLDGIPLTSADGQTPLELIDAFDLNRIEVIKGPAGSMYGSGNGGVVLMTGTRIDSGVVRLQSGIQYASYNSYRQFASVSLGFKRSELRISQVRQDYPGYREQEFNRKKQFSIYLKQRLTEYQTLTIMGTYYNGTWGLPGALNQVQADTMPTMAVAFSQLNNASLARERYLGAISQSGKWGKHFSHSLNLNYQKTNKENPYGTSSFNSGYKFENAQSITGRATIDYTTTINEFDLHLTAGGEWQTEEFSILEKTIEQAQPKDYKYSYDIDYLETMFFTQGVFSWRQRISLQAGVSRSVNEQYVHGGNSSGFEFDTTTTWGKSVLPRAALSVKLIKNLYAYSNFSLGAANPTVFEMIDQENNAYNRGLTSERGKLTEIGVRHQIEKVGIEYSVTAYDFQIDGAILPYTIINAAGESLQRYHNDGSTSQQGIEWNFQWKLTSKTADRSVKIWNNGTLNRHRFDSYTLEGTAYNGNRLPGVPLGQMSTGIQALYNDFNFSLFDYWMDRMPLNNSGTDQTNSYHLINALIGYTAKPFQQFECALNAGINNILNTSYSSYLNINGAGDKYYNPAPTRNFYIGVHVKYVLPMK